MLAHDLKGGSSNIELLTQFAAHAVCATQLNEYPVYSLQAQLLFKACVTFVKCSEIET